VLWLRLFPEQILNSMRADLSGSWVFLEPKTTRKICLSWQILGQANFRLLDLAAKSKFSVASHALFSSEHRTHPMFGMPNKLHSFRNIPSEVATITINPSFVFKV
jgi:hypothetical protein